MFKRIYKLIFALLLFAASGILSAKVRFNEVLFSTSSPDEEFIELYNEGPGTVSLDNWQLSVNGDLLYIFPEGTSLAEGAYLLINIGDPASPPANSISLEKTIAQLPDGGAELLLINSSELPVDYIAYGSFVANPPTPLIFPNSINLTYLQAGDSIAFLPSGSDSDDPKQWINRRGANITPGEENTEQPEPSISYGNISVPESFPTVNSCEIIQVPINISYDSETPLADAKVEFTLPAEMLFYAASDNGDFDDNTRTITWKLETLEEDKALSFSLKPGCDSSSSDFAADALLIKYACYSTQSDYDSKNSTNAHEDISILYPELDVTIVDWTSKAAGIIANIGKLVELEVKVTNTGSGALLEETAWVNLSLAPGNIALLGIRKNSSTGPPIANLVKDPAAGMYSGFLAPIPAGGEGIYYVKILTVGCPLEYGCVQAEITMSCTDSSPGTAECKKVSHNVANIFCPPEIEFAVPEDEPTVYNGCQDVRRTVIIKNSNGVPIQPQDLVVNLPQNYYWISSEIDGVHAGVYDQVGGTLTFTRAELAKDTSTEGAGPSIAGGGEVKIDLVMRPNCFASTDRMLSADMNYEIYCPRRTYDGFLTQKGDLIKLLQPALSVAIQNPDTPNITTVEAERGEIVEFKVVVTNNGLGDLNTDGKDPGEEGGWLEFGNIGSGLSLQEIRDISGGGAGTLITPEGDPLQGEALHWPTGAIDSHSSKTYSVKFLVIDCDDVDYDIGTYWTCAGTHEDDHCRQDGESKGSVNILLRNPSLSIEAEPFIVDYCNGVEVSYTITNASKDGIGPARDVKILLIGLNLSDYDIILPEESDFTVDTDGAFAVFSLEKVMQPDDPEINKRTWLEKGESIALDFEVKLKAGRCSASSGSILVIQPEYEDSCAIPYNSGTEISSFSRTAAPEVRLSKTGPATAQIGQKNLEWTVTLSYIGAPEDEFEYVLVDDYPDVSDDPLASFSFVSISDTDGQLDEGDDYTNVDGKISINRKVSFDENGKYEETFTFVLNAPEDPCAGGRSFANEVSLNIIKPEIPQDCNSCPLDAILTDSSPIYLNNIEEEALDRHNRKVTYENKNIHGLDNSTYQDAAEVCTTLVYDQYVRFTDAAPDAWQVNVDTEGGTDMRSVRFYDQLDRQMRAPGGIKNDLKVEIYYFDAGWEPSAPGGTDYGPTGNGLVSWNDITYTAPSLGNNGSISIDLKGLGDVGSPGVPSDKKVLWIRYTLESQAESRSEFIDLGSLIVPTPGGNHCGLGAERYYHYFTNVNIVDPQLTVSIEGDNHVSRCETTSLRFNIGSLDARPFDCYDARLRVNLGDNYTYIAQSTVFGDGFSDEGGQDFTAFEPVISSNILTWNLGDLRSLASSNDTYIEIEVQKTCDTSSTDVVATVFNNTMCSQVDDANGPGLANQQDSAIAGIESFSHNSSSTYSPELFSGRLETRFASSKVYYNDGYPKVLLHVVNAGNGNLYNVRVPVELGDVYEGTASLTFVEANITAISGNTSLTSGTVIEPIDPASLGTTKYDHGYREVTFAIDWMEPSSIITIELQLRMVLCQDLSLRIVESHWGCPEGKDHTCIEDLSAPELNSSMNILSGTARALITEHSSNPGVIDLCGSKTRITIEALNSGGIDVYEPTIRERLPEGMKIVEESAQYSLDGGATFAAFPTAKGYSKLETKTTPGIGDYQIITWVFTDPNLDGSEADSLLSTSAYDDPYPDDEYFNRHKVMKPGTRIKIQFDVELEGCEDALAYKKSERKAEAALLFDLPCHHDNRLYPNGEKVPGDGLREPLDDSTKESTFLDPGEAIVVIDLEGRNKTQNPSGDFIFSQVNGEKDNILEWNIAIDSIGNGVVPHPVLEILVPNILSVDFENNPPEIISPSNIVFDGNPTVDDEGTNTRYTFVFKNTNQAMIDAGREFYFSATEAVKIKFSSTISSCSDERPLLEAIIRRGCCEGIEGLESSSGFDKASTAIKTRPDSPEISIVEGDVNLVPGFNSCIGAYTITLKNPDVNNELSLYELDITLPLPPGWAYAPLEGNGCDFIYEVGTLRPEGEKLTQAEEEPLIDNNNGVLRWTSINRGGQIANSKAKLYPQEEIKIIVYLRADPGSSINCDSDPAPNHVVPGFTQEFSLANYEDSCGDPLDSPMDTSVAIKPKYPILDLTLTPDERFIGADTTEIVWELKLHNSGSLDAENIELDLLFDVGYSAVQRDEGIVQSTQNGNHFDWEKGVITLLEVGDTISWKFTATINHNNRDSLSAKAIVSGHCVERDGITEGCTYSYVENEQFISGAAISKKIDGTKLAAPAISTDPAANSNIATEADVTIGSIVRYLITVEVYEGGSNDLIIRDVLPEGLKFLEANLVNSNDVFIQSLTPSFPSLNLVTFSYEDFPGLLGNVIQGRLDTNAIFIEIWAQVINNTSLNQKNGKLINTAQLTIKRMNQTFDHNTPDLSLYESNTLTIIEPFIREDDDYVKKSDPESLPSNYVGPVFDIDDKPDGDNPVEYVFTAKNTGSSPAYEIEFIDEYPWQLEEPSALTAPYEMSVKILSAANVERALIKNTDYSITWTAAVDRDPAEFKINLLSTSAAILDVGETLQITYYGMLKGFTPGGFMNNSAKITTYSSLPDKGATLQTAKNTSLKEEDEERISYADEYRELTDRKTYHKFTEELLESALIKSEITPHSDDTAPELRDDGTTRATIGEQVEYHIRLSMPNMIIFDDLNFICDIPDGLRVREASWEVVAVNGDFVGAGNSLTVTPNAGISEVRGQAGTDANDFPEAFSNNSGTNQELLVKILFTVDREYAGGTAVKEDDSFELPAKFTWSREEDTISNEVDPIPEFTVLEPKLTTLAKERSAHLLADNSTAATSPGIATYNNYNTVGPDNHNSLTDPVNNVYQVRAGEIVEYKVTFKNEGKATAWNIELQDIIPLGMKLRSTSVSIITDPIDNDIAITDPTPASTVVFAINRVLPETEVTVTYRCNVDTDVAAGRYLQNQVDLIQYSSLPEAPFSTIMPEVKYPDADRSMTSNDAGEDSGEYAALDSVFEKVGTPYPLSSKTVETELTEPSGKLNDGTSNATIGELVTYEIILDIPDTSVCYDLSFIDVIPDGLEVQKAVYTYKGGTETSLNINVNTDGTTTVNDTNPLGDLAGEENYENELIITITATVKQKYNDGTTAVAAGDEFGNNATFTWNQIDDDDDNDTENTQNAEDDEVEFTVAEPLLDVFAKTIVRVLDSDANSNVTYSRGHSGVVSAGADIRAINGKSSYYKYPVGGGTPELITDVQVVLPDDIVEYAISVTNSGTATAFDVKISDIMPPQFAMSLVPDDDDEFLVNTVNLNGVNHTRLDFVIDMLAPEETAVITYRAQVEKNLGAGYYIGDNEAKLNDYSTLPDDVFTVDVGNLPAGETVFNKDLQRDTISEPAYSTQGPVGEDIGVQYPEFATKVYRVYDENGNENITELIEDTYLRIGDVLVYEMIATLPRYTVLFDGGNSALAYRHRLNRGYHLIDSSEEFDLGNIDLTALHQGSSPVIGVVGNNQYPAWFFSDIVNNTSDPQTAGMSFRAVVKNEDYSNTPYFVDQTAAYSETTRSYLFWNTIDNLEKEDLNFSSAVNNGDHPFLQRDNFNTIVVQPNLELIKNSDPEPGSTIGTSNTEGDKITYTLTLRNWNSTSAGAYRGQGTAYCAKVQDIIPKDLAPIPPAEPTLIAAVYALDGDGNPDGAALRTLAVNDDYSYVYSFDNTSCAGTIDFVTLRNAADCKSAIEQNTALVITYELEVNPAIGAQGSGAGQRVNYAMLEEYYSFPEGVNDDARKEYGPDGPRRVSLHTQVPEIEKSSDCAGESVSAGRLIEYKITAPKEAIRANLYDVEIIDILPDGLTFPEIKEIKGDGPGPVVWSSNGDDYVIVNGAKGEVTISVGLRKLNIKLEHIEAEGGDDQIEITFRVKVNTAFENTAPIPRLHEFVNTAALYWYDDDDSFPDRVRYATLSNSVSHFYEASGILFEPSHTGTAQPATIRTYRHWLRNFEDEDIDVEMTFDNTQEKWTWQLFMGDGEGNVVSGPFESGHIIKAPANDAVEVIMRAFVPAEITALTTDILTITAESEKDEITVTDVTVVQVERIAVFKDISTDNVDFATRLEVEAGKDANVTQRIRFYNNGPEIVKNVYIYDFIPDYSCYMANSAVNNLEFALEYSTDGGVNWTVGEPAEKGETVINGVIPKVTNLRWLYNAGNELIPGEEKEITFQIRID